MEAWESKMRDTHLRELNDLIGEVKARSAELRLRDGYFFEPRKIISFKMGAKRGGKLPPKFINPAIEE